MKTTVDQFFIGTITDILDKEEWVVEFTVPGVISKGKAFPYRGELDEPQIGNVIEVHSYDPDFGSYFLYRKLKEGKFNGFRCNGKIVDMTPEKIKIGIGAQGNSADPDDFHPSLTTWMEMDNKGNMKVYSGGDGNIEIVAAGDLTIKAGGNINIEGNVNVKGNFTYGGGTFKISGFVSSGANVAGPFVNIPNCAPNAPIGTTSFITS